VTVVRRAFAQVGIVFLAATGLGCTSSHSARAICDRHFTGTTATRELTVRDALEVGGPKLTHPERQPIAKYPYDDRVVRCLVPASSDSAEVWDVVVTPDKTFRRWTQSGGTWATKRFAVLS
jgi:hypothetical protein